MKSLTNVLKQVLNVIHRSRNDLDRINIAGMGGTAMFAASDSGHSIFTPFFTPFGVDILAAMCLWLSLFCLVNLITLTKK